MACSNPADIHDTDPAPAPKRGNGHDDGLPCAVHAAELVALRDMVVTVAQEAGVTREILKELRDLTKAQSTRLEDEIVAREKRDAETTGAILELVGVIGEPPDESTGKPGRGMRGQWVKAINTVLREGARREMPSILDDESDITSVMERPTLVVAKRKAERGQAEAEKLAADTEVKLIEARSKARRATIAAYAAAAAVVIGALAAGIATAWSSFGG